MEQPNKLKASVKLFGLLKVRVHDALENGSNASANVLSLTAKDLVVTIVLALLTVFVIAGVLPLVLCAVELLVAAAVNRLHRRARATAKAPHLVLAATVVVPVHGAALVVVAAVEFDSDATVDFTVETRVGSAVRQLPVTRIRSVDTAEDAVFIIVVSVVLAVLDGLAVVAILVISQDHIRVIVTVLAGPAVNAINLGPMLVTIFMVAGLALLFATTIGVITTVNVDISRNA